MKSAIVSWISCFSSSFLAFLYCVLYPFKVFNILANFSILSWSLEEETYEIYDCFGLLFNSSVICCILPSIYPICFLRDLIYLFDAFSTYLLFFFKVSDSSYSYGSSRFSTSSSSLFFWSLIGCFWAADFYISSFESNYSDDASFSLSMSTLGSAVSPTESPAFPMASAEWGSTDFSYATEAFAFLWWVFGAGVSYSGSWS